MNLSFGAERRQPFIEDLTEGNSFYCFVGVDSTFWKDQDRILVAKGCGRGLVPKHNAASALGGGRDQKFCCLLICCDQFGSSFTHQHHGDIRVDCSEL